jgi:thiamine pyrophosphokinase
MRRVISLSWISSQAPIDLVVLSSQCSASLYEQLRPRAVQVIVADGAANSLVAVVERLGTSYLPTAITGDFDSILPGVQEYFRTGGCEIVQNPSQDNTDLEKCLDFLTRLPSSGPVVVIGEISRRVDHSIAILSVLFRPAYADVELFLCDQHNLSFVLREGVTQVHSSSVKWSYVGLLPVYKPTVVTSTGLKWDLTGQVLSMSGLVSSSNEALSEVVQVQTSEMLLWSCHAQDFLAKS